ncbi:MAG: hypothetical protein QOK28_2796 [Actinomycetota bacterium]|jgi:hypothetical protein
MRNAQMPFLRIDAATAERNFAAAASRSWNAASMAFGDAVTTNTRTAEADWIAPALGTFGTVGGVVPGGYESYLLIDFRTERDGIGWEGVQLLFAELAAPLIEATSTPEDCFFAIWEGYGFTSGTTAYAFYGDSVDREEMERLRREARLDDAERNRQVTAALSLVPTFELPHRRYYIVAGAVEAAARITRPDHAGPQPPDLWWPKDHRWFVGGDTDLDWCYLAGSRQLTDSVHVGLGWPTRTIAWEATNLDAGLTT